MLGGFNTNVGYRGRTFHVQTEDSGQGNPKIVTLLYEGGTILTSRKSSYEEIVSAENLESVVRELMEEQHREVVQALKAGELDGVIGVDGGAAQPKKRSGRGKAPAPRLSANFGDGIITDTPMDELVLAHLASS